MKLSNIFDKINQALKENMEKENHTREWTDSRGNTRTIMSSSRKCNSFSKFKDFKENETKLFITPNQVSYFIKEELCKVCSVDFFVSHQKNSLFKLAVYQLNVKDIGLDEKYQKVVPTFLNLAYFNIKRKKTTFGEVSSYDHNMGNPIQEAVASEIVIQEDFDICETIIEKIKRLYELEEKRNETINSKKEAFEKKLKELNLSNEDFQLLKSMEV